jgi:hypothetical protein
MTSDVIAKDQKKKNATPDAQQLMGGVVRPRHINATIATATLDAREQPEVPGKYALADAALLECYRACLYS